MNVLNRSNTYVKHVVDIDQSADAQQCGGHDRQDQRLRRIEFRIKSWLYGIPSILQNEQLKLFGCSQDASVNRILHVLQREEIRPLLRFTQMSCRAARYLVFLFLVIFAALCWQKIIPTLIGRLNRQTTQPTR